jgi:hypothetical protein
MVCPFGEDAATPACYGCRVLHEPVDLDRPAATTVRRQDDSGHLGAMSAVAPRLKGELSAPDDPAVGSFAGHEHGPAPRVDLRAEGAPVVDGLGIGQQCEEPERCTSVHAGPKQVHQVILGGRQRKGGQRLEMDSGDRGLHQAGLCPSRTMPSNPACRFGPVGRGRMANLRCLIRPVPFVMRMNEVNGHPCNS